MGAGRVHRGQGVGGARRLGVVVPDGRHRRRERHPDRGDWPLPCWLNPSLILHRFSSCDSALLLIYLFPYKDVSALSLPNFFGQFSSEAVLLFIWLKAVQPI